MISVHPGIEGATDKERNVENEQDKAILVNLSEVVRQ
jgi:hypothetical protein